MNKKRKIKKIFIKRKKEITSTFHFDDEADVLTQKQTACLAQDACGVPEVKAEVANSCAPGSGCC
jgi:hypothetical protein